MSGLLWLTFAIGAAAASLYAAWWYRTREEPVRGRTLAAVLRAGALSGAWLILLNPNVPAELRPGPPGPAVLLDGSLSMDRPVAREGASLWERALDSLPAVEGLWLFGGDQPRYSDIDSIPDAPFFTDSRLAPALRTAAAAGARRLVIVSDGAIVDSSAAVEALRRHGLAASFIGLSPSYPQAGIARVDAPAWLEENDTAEVQLEFVASAGGQDSLTVQVVDSADRVLASRRVGRPATGRFGLARLRFSLAGPPGYRRLVASLVQDSADLESRDNRRPFYVRVTDRPAGPVLISLRPDWEVSFLLPHLDRLTDFPTSAYVRIADSLTTLEGYRRVSPAVVARRARAAPLLVVHGYGSDAPDWIDDLVSSTNRLLMFPHGMAAFLVPGWDLRVGAAMGGEWYPSDQVPASPLALSLEGIPLADLPPLVRVRSVQGADGIAPLVVLRLRRGEAVAALRIGQSRSRRWAVATGEGYWRWAFRPGAGGDLYRALWSGVGGWLLADRDGGPDRGLGPRQRVVERGEALSWTAPSGADSLSLVLLSGDSVIWQGTASGGDSLRIQLSPGRYRYRVRAYGTGRAEAATGPVEVEEFSSDLLPRKRVAVEGTYGSGRGEVQEGRRRLASLGWPFLVLIALFCAEWGVRRSIGLS